MLVLSQVLTPPSHQAVQMIAKLRDGLFVTSNDNHSLEVWKEENGQFIPSYTVTYEEYVGVANSGAITQDNQGNSFFVAGHENGYITIWQLTKDLKLNSGKAIDIHSPDPIHSPYPLKNIRAVVPWKSNIIITGSEDGDLCMIDVSNAKVVFRMRYNPDAQRGINHLDILGDYLLVCNCTVGRNDKNLWLYKLNKGMITYFDSANLVKDVSKQQVFDFEVALSAIDNIVYFFAGTGEGLIWYGKIMDNKLNVLGNIGMDDNIGAALSIDTNPNVIAAAAHSVSLYLFKDGVLQKSN